MKNIIYKAMTTILIAVFLSPAAFSQQREELNLKRLESKLNLTDTQKDQIEKLRLDHQKAMIDLKANLEKARLELREITSKDDFTRNEYLAAHSKMAKLREDIQLAGANHRMDVLDLMNKDQRKIIAENRLLNGSKKNFGKKGRGDRQSDRPQMRQRMQNH